MLASRPPNGLARWLNFHGIRSMIFFRCSRKVKEHRWLWLHVLYMHETFCSVGPQVHNLYLSLLPFFSALPMYKARIQQGKNEGTIEEGKIYDQKIKCLWTAEPKIKQRKKRVRAPKKRGRLFSRRNDQHEIEGLNLK